MTERYTLANTDAERARLIRQAEILRPITERLMRSAGIGPAMAVLDVGTGAGDVAALVAALVGDEGRVLGFDRDAQQVAAARLRWSQQDNIEFVQATIAEPPAGEFDAIVGRLVLMYEPDLEAAIRSLARRLRPGGSMAFLEQNIRPGAQQAIYWPPTPLAMQVAAWIEKGFAATSTQLLTGLRLPAALRAAGLIPQPPYETGAFVYEGRSRAEMSAGLVRSMLPVLESAGVTPTDIDIDTLADRLYAEGGDDQISAVGPCFGVWARKPQ